MDKRIVLIAKLLIEKTEVLLILFITIIFIAVYICIGGKSAEIFGKLTEHPENLDLFKEYIVFTIISYIFETSIDVFSSICKFFSNIFISNWIFNIIMKENFKDFEKTTPEAHLTNFVLQRDAFTDFIILLLFKIPINTANSIFILCNLFSKQNRSEAAGFLILLISPIYTFLSFGAVAHRKKMMKEITAATTDKNSQCRSALDNYETVTANKQQKRQRRLFLEKLYITARKKTRYFIVSENYRLAMRVGIVIIKLVFIFLRTSDDKMAIGPLLSMVGGLSRSLLNLRNDLFMLIEYKNLVNIKDTNSKDVQVEWNDQTAIKLLVNTSKEFQVSPGRPVLLTGSSGCGKTNALQAVVGVTSDRYRATINGLDTSLADRTSLCAGISFLSQHQHLFSGSIESNLLLGTGLSSNVLREKLDQLGFRDYFDQFPNGFSTLVGEKTFGLSNGQKQLICVLRCVLRDAKVYLFDEPGMFLDSQHEEIVYQIILQLQNRCVVVASQSMKHLEMFDSFVKLD